MGTKRLWFRLIVVVGTRSIALLLGFAWLVGYGSLLAQAAEPPPTLLVYNTVERLLDGDLLHTVTMDEVRSDLAAFPPDWPVVGVGTTDWVERSGEMMPDGTIHKDVRARPALQKFYLRSLTIMEKEAL